MTEIVDDDDKKTVILFRFSFFSPSSHLIRSATSRLVCLLLVVVVTTLFFMLLRRVVLKCLNESQWRPLKTRCSAFKLLKKKTSVVLFSCFFFPFLLRLTIWVGVTSVVMFSPIPIPLSLDVQRKESNEREDSLLATARTKYDYRSVLFYFFVFLLLSLAVPVRSAHDLHFNVPRKRIRFQWAMAGTVRCVFRVQKAPRHTTRSRPGFPSNPFKPGRMVITRHRSVCSPCSLPTPLQLVVVVVVVYIFSLSVHTHCLCFTLPGCTFYLLLSPPLLFFFYFATWLSITAIPALLFHLEHVEKERHKHVIRRALKMQKPSSISPTTPITMKEDVVSFHCSKSNCYVTLCYVTRGTNTSSVHWSYYFRPT